MQPHRFNPMADISVSYAKTDRSLASKLVAMLEAEGWNGVLDKLMTDLIPGNPVATSNEEDQHDQPSGSALGFGSASRLADADCQRSTNQTGWQLGFFVCRVW